MDHGGYLAAKGENIFPVKFPVSRESDPADPNALLQTLLSRGFRPRSLEIVSGRTTIAFDHPSDQEDSTTEAIREFERSVLRSGVRA